MITRLLRWPRALVLGLALLASACTDDQSTEAADSATDIGSPGDITAGDSIDGTGPGDAVADAAPDAGSDAGSDAVDTSGDAPGPDAGPDAAMDADTGGPEDTGSSGGCCDGDADCPEGEGCVGAGGDNTGVCKAIPAEGRCWTAAQCGDGQDCLGGSVCPCNLDCFGPDSLGYCAPAGVGCCATDDQCGEGDVCVTLAEGPGVCMPGVSGGACWTDADCPAGVKCNGATVCPCGALCGTAGQPGTCQGGPVGCCTTDFDCGEGERCVGNGAGNAGVCKPVPGWGQCWDGNDCAPTQSCAGGSVCPCDADCDQPDTVGTCTGPDQGCCTGAGVCPDGQQCAPLSGIGWSTCVAKPEDGRCWSEADCPAGHTCEGQALCPCNMDCDMDYEGPGVCTPPGGACTTLQTSWVLEWCDAANLVIWNGKACEATCLGCCECKPFCDKTFESMEACESACLPPTGCALWDGTCDDTLAAIPLWAYTPAGCVEVPSCGCDGCPGTFPTAEACAAACLE